MTNPNNQNVTGTVNNLEHVFFKIDQESLVSDPVQTFDSWFAPEDATLVNQAISDLYVDRNSGPGFPDWNAFIDYIGSISDPITAQRVEENFVKGYRFTLFADPTVPSGIDINAVAGEDWTVLTPDGLPISGSQIQSQFQQAFTTFSQNFPIELVDQNGNVQPSQVNPGTFKENFMNYFSRGVVMQNSSLNELPPDQTVFKNNQLVDSYEEMYNIYYPNTGETDEKRAEIFNLLMNAFYLQEVNETGFFIPTVSFQNWGTFLNTSASSGIFGTETSLASLGSSELQILNRIYALLVDMIDVLQETAAIQSDRLNLYTKWQAAYTEQISTIPVFVSGDGSYPGGSQGDGDTTKFINFRSDLANLNSSYKEQLSAERQVIGDEATSQQTAINQSTDAVTQQSNMATSLLEQQSTLLSAIYR